MRPTVPRAPSRLFVLAFVLVAGLNTGETCNSPNHHEPVGHQTFTSPQSRPILLSGDGARLYVANTTSNSVSVFRTSDNALLGVVEVGVEPVGLAEKPDGTELWVANHVSDSVSVVDMDVASDTYLRIKATVQDLDGDGVTQFDEPVGVAFASNAKAYVSLSSRNDVAIVDATSYQVTGRIHITAQEPRSLRVVGNRLYVAAFESNNRSELAACPDPGGSGGPGPPVGDQSAGQCTLGLDDLVDFIIASPNIPGAQSDIIFDPDVPDRDLFVIDTTTDTLVDTVSGVGTLLYDLAITSDHDVFVTQTEARNVDNGATGDNLIDLQNRMFLNQIGRVDCGGGSCSALTAVELEPPPGSAVPTALATPYGIEVSGDDSTLVVTAMGTSRVFTMDAGTGAVLDVLDLNDGVAADFGQQIPKGVALLSDGTGAPQTAYVLNTLENTVSVVDVSNPSSLGHTAKIPVGSDPTPDDIRKGRIAFNNAFASTDGTFSCESCHPDGHTDQLIWRIGGACFFGDCSEDDEPRTTMPVRGLKNTLPLHWDGTLGDPFGGPNGATGTGGNGGSDCNLGGADGDLDCFEALVDGSLSGVMCEQQGGCTPGLGQTGPDGSNKDGELTDTERTNMARFLRDVVYPPARERRLDDTVSPAANQGFSDFFVDVGGLGELLPGDQVRTCADMNSGCHALPLGVDHNSPTLGAFDAPTMRGMTDRWLQFSIGITNSEETHEWARLSRVFNLTIPGIPFPVPITTPASVNPYSAADGMEELVTFTTAFAIFQPVYGKGPNDMFQMFEEASTGYSGALGRQVTLNQDTTAPGTPLTTTSTLLDELEDADGDGLVNLRAVGVRNGTRLLLSFRDDDTYKNAADNLSLTRAQLITEAQAGTTVMTMTAALPQNYGQDTHRMPLLSVRSTGDGPAGNPDLPILPGANPIQLAGIDVREDAQILLNGEVVAGSISCDMGGQWTPYCTSEKITITLSQNPTTQDLHLLQVQNPNGPLSPELPICYDSAADCL